MRGNFRESETDEGAARTTPRRQNRMSLKIVLPPANDASNSSSPHAFMDAGAGRANGYDVDKEYDHVMEQAMQAYFVHSRGRNVPRIQTSRNGEATPRDWTMSQDSWPCLGTGRREVQSARFGRVVRVPPTVSMNRELDVLEGSRAMTVRPKRRPLTATRIRYPITGKMSQYPFVTTPKSRSEQTTPVKVPKPPTSNGSAQSLSNNHAYGGGLFLRYGSKPRDFTIHPDWVSENIQIAKLTLTDRNAQSQDFKYQTYPPRRCQSAPPPLYRNPITWQ